jgi:excisionase family DNA binding protein
LYDKKLVEEIAKSDKVRTISLGRISVARATVAGERSSYARAPKQEVLDPVPAPLRADSDVLARLAALEAQVAGKMLGDRGQPTDARPPPTDDTSVRVYTVAETAKILRLGLTRTYDFIVKGRIPAIKLGGRWLVPHDALVRLLREAGG